MTPTPPALFPDDSKASIDKYGCIDRFQGSYRFLSNFYRAEVFFEGRIYPSAEHAYQAAKTLDVTDREMIQNLKTPGDAKRAGKGVALRPHWDLLKRDIMLAIVRNKFSTIYLKAMLLGTGERVLVEGNHWGDTYWGRCNGRGENHLGKILMQVREELRRGL